MFCGLEDKVMEEYNRDENYGERMTNEEYREKLNEIFSDINENYKLCWFYNFVVAKIEGSK